MVIILTESLYVFLVNFPKTFYKGYDIHYNNRKYAVSLQLLIRWIISRFIKVRVIFSTFVAALNISSYYYFI